MKGNFASQPQKPAKKMSKKKTSLIVLCTVLALILFLLILGTAYMESMFGLLNQDVDNNTMSAEEYEKFLTELEEDNSDLDLEVVDPDSIQWADAVAKLEDSDDVINILLVGQDRRPGEGRQRSDAMILCTVNIKTKTLTMTSFMRDMYVQIPGYYDNRINTCYPIGGFELLNECLEVNFGVEVDGNLEVDFNGFQEIIDMMGGVDIELTDSEAAYMNSHFGTSVTGGWNHLDGKAALGYSRIRHVGNGDFGRTNRQRTVLAALMESCKDLSLTQLNSLAKSILPMITTDISNADIMNYIIVMFPLLSDLTINTQRIPADGTYYGAMIREMAVLVPDLEANRELLADSMNN